VLRPGESVVSIDIEDRASVAKEKKGARRTAKPLRDKEPT
jgi:hypothetical protein